MKKMLILLLVISLIPLSTVEAFSDKLTVDMHYMVITPSDEGTIQVKHTVNYTNIGEEEFNGDPQVGGVLAIPLPSGALDLQVQDETLGIKEMENGFITNKPIAPKDTQVISYSYSIPVGVPISLKMDYSLQVMQVLIPEGAGSVAIEGAKNTNAGLMQFEEKNFWLYSIENIAQNSEIKLVYDKDAQPPQEEAVAGKEQDAASSDAKDTTSKVTRNSPQFHNPGHLRLWYQSPLKKFNPHILLIVLGAIIAAGLGYYSYFRWKARLQHQRMEGDQEEQLFKQLIARQNAIMDKIVELEDSYGQGNVTEADYLAKLEAYKQHLVKVKVNLRQFIE
jgi:hypothetical protein